MERVDEVRFTAIGEVEVAHTEVELVPGDGEALIAPERIGICGSDMHVLHGKHPFVRPPLVTGHEAVATVVEVGAGVSGDLVGRRVLVNPLVAPGDRSGDWRGAINVQEDARVMGFKLSGLARTRTVVPAEQLHLVPADLDATIAVLGEPLAAGIHAAQRSGGRLEDVLIIGGGPIGLSVLLGVRREGAGHVTLVEPVASKRELALELGADAVFAPDEADLPVKHFTTVFDCVSAPATLAQAVDVTRGGGAVVVMGVPGTVPVDLPLPRMQRFEIDLLGSGMYTGADIDAAIDYLSQHPEPASHLVSRVFPLTEAADAYAAVGEPDNVKVVLSL
ncbi:alcohol dehydrogenase catalytic domain-containing protein [Microbacterium sp.]|uniref:zinc-dependent alcohol dehydrogenase n=1 Tax=Microbacterium sp. TaxID=51671 RepID=UPI0028128E3E|nr:alcohol dehydrogenase catalytic domain-containing protein [Microbacterium sp.]